MRDVFWTIIVIWLIYQLVNIFKGAGRKKTYAYQQNQARQKTGTEQSDFTKKDVKNAVKKHADKEGEYIDYEEVR